MVQAKKPHISKENQSVVPLSHPLSSPRAFPGAGRAGRGGHSGEAHSPAPPGSGTGSSTGRRWQVSLSRCRAQEEAASGGQRLRPLPQRVAGLGGKGRGESAETAAVRPGAGLGRAARRRRRERAVPGGPKGPRGELPAAATEDVGPRLHWAAASASPGAAPSGHRRPRPRRRAGVGGPGRACGCAPGSGAARPPAPPQRQKQTETRRDGPGPAGPRRGPRRRPALPHRPAAGTTAGPGAAAGAGEGAAGAGLTAWIFLSRGSKMAEYPARRMLGEQPLPSDPAAAAVTPPPLGPAGSDEGRRQPPPHGPARRSATRSGPTGSGVKELRGRGGGGRSSLAALPPPPAGDAAQRLGPLTSRGT